MGSRAAKHCSWVSGDDGWPQFSARRQLIERARGWQDPGTIDGLAETVEDARPVNVQFMSELS